MKKRQLGQSGLEVSAIGFASHHGGPITRAQQIAVLRAARDFGVSFFDAGQALQAGEELLGEAIAPFRKHVAIATGLDLYEGGPAKIRSAADASLQRLGVEAIDLFYLRRIDPTLPIEDAAGAVQELIAEGKVKHFGLSDADATTIRRAHAVLPVAAVQAEYSLWHREPESSLLQTFEELGIGFVARSPLGGGLQLDALAGLAERKHATPAQLALAWLLAQQPWIVPMPATRRIGHADENLGGADLELSDADLHDIDTVFTKPPLPRVTRGTAHRGPPSRIRCHN